MKKNINNQNKSKFNLILISIIIVVVLGIMIFIIAYSKNNNKKEEKKDTIIQYSCIEDYTLDNKKCVKEVENIDPNVNYSCDSGYELKKDKCVRYEYADSSVEWTCPSGYDWYENKKPNLCYKEITESLIVKQYYCTNGYTLNGTKCVKEELVPASISHGCGNGSSLYNESVGLCFYLPIEGSCPRGAREYQRNGRYVTCVTDPYITYNCPSNSTKSGTKCIISSETIDAKTVRGCKNGYNISSDQTYCIKIDYEVPSYKLSCKKGYTLNKENCIKKISIDAKKSISCNSGYELKNDKCIKYDIQEPIMIKE